MAMHSFTTTRALIIGALALCLVGDASVVDAQIPVDTSKAVGIYQDGRLVGEIFRADPPTERYLEHWVLYPEYRDGVVTTLIPGVKTYRGVDGFLASVPFAKGARYFAADCFDGTALPR